MQFGVLFWPRRVSEEIWIKRRLFQLPQGSSGISISRDISRIISALRVKNHHSLVCVIQMGFTPLLRGLGLCGECTQSLQSSLTVFGAKSSAFENRVLTAHEICITCAGTSPGEPVECISLDCPWLYARKKAEDKLKTIETMELIVNELEQSETQFIANWGDTSESEM